jgi:hypothetical protein
MNGGLSSSQMSDELNPPEQQMQLLEPSQQQQPLQSPLPQQQSQQIPEIQSDDSIPAKQSESVDFQTGDTDGTNGDRDSSAAIVVSDDSPAKTSSNALSSRESQSLQGHHPMELRDSPDEVRKSKGLSLEQRVKLFSCDDLNPRSHVGQRGPFWVLYNYVTGSRRIGCDESITYTTHADFTFLDNLIPLLDRWQGPISLSLYSPGTDFNETLKRILYLRECSGFPLVKELVSFHLFFDYKHIPKQSVPRDPMNIPVNCSSKAYAELRFEEGLPTYKKAKKLPYPVNVARNVAREMSATHYILPSDIELYPSPNLIPDFMDMIRRNETELQRPNPKVYVLSIFEVEASVTALPHDKLELLYMLNNKSAIPFHKYVCSDCHRIPKAKEWLTSPVKPGINVFHIGKRLKPFHHWEPIYIGTKFDPMYDERLTWEGRSDKMTQGYVLCVLDYEFHILDNAFLVHRPGIKTIRTIPSKNPVVAKQNTIIARIILPELKLLYGTKPGCYV